MCLGSFFGTNTTRRKAFQWPVGYVSRWILLISYRALGRVRGFVRASILSAMQLVRFVLFVAAAASAAAQTPSVPPVPAQPAWQMQESGTTASLRGIDSVDGKIAWASGSGGTVLRTIDGGAH